MISIKTITSILLLNLFLFTSCLSKDKKKLPFLGKHTVKSKDTVLYSIPTYNFLRQDGINFGSADLKGKPYVAYFFFTSCPSVCPRMTQGARRIQQALLKDIERYNIVAFSVDPERDTPESLKLFAKEYNADFKNWHFLRGLEKDIFKVSQKSFYVGVSKSEEEPGGYMHSEKMILVDSEGHLRGYYSGTDATDVEKLIGDLSSIMK